MTTTYLPNILSVFGFLYSPSIIPTRLTKSNSSYENENTSSKIYSSSRWTTFYRDSKCHAFPYRHEWPIQIRLGGSQSFFVISGFLITGILLDSKGRNNYFRNFYIRRSLRIFPIYYLTLISVILLWFLKSNWGIRESFNYYDWPYYLVYFQNYVLGIEKFHANFPPIFNHSWSLAVEEQFYFIWPAVVYIFDRKALSKIILGLFFFSIISRIITWQITANSSLVQTALYNQFDGLVSGGFIALLFRENLFSRKNIVLFARLIGFVVFILCVISYLTQSLVSGLDTNIWFYSLLAIFFTAVVIEITIGNGLASRFLSNPILIYIGKISYGLYLYHFPIFWFIHSTADVLGISVQIVPILQFLVTFFLSILSWHFLESPLLKLKEHFAYDTSKREPTV